jgi:hypothetical protein
MYANLGIALVVLLFVLLLAAGPGRDGPTRL